MILDAYLHLSAGQQVTADAVSTNTIDLLNANPARKIGVGKAITGVFAITAKGTNSGSAKLQVIQSAAANLGSPQILGEIDLAAGDILVGKIFKVGVGAGIPGLRYLGVNYDITGTVDFTVDAYIQPDDMASIVPDVYAKNYVV